MPNPACKICLPSSFSPRPPLSPSAPPGLTLPLSGNSVVGKCVFMASQPNPLPLMPGRKTLLRAY